MTKRLLLTAVAALTCFAATPPPYLSKAHAQATELKVKKNKVYQHAHSGVKLPPRMTGYDRNKARSYFSNDLDVSFQYTSDDQQNLISIYIYRRTNGNASIWFDRAKYPIETRDVYGKVTPIAPPSAFLPPFLGNAAAMRVSYAATGGQYKATGLMLIPVNDWYVKIRASSSTKTAEELDLWMDQALTEIIWPEKIADQPTANVIDACEDALFFRGDAQAVGKKEDSSMITGLLGSVLGAMAEKGIGKVVEESTQWCRDDSAKLLPSAIYRLNGSTNSYLYALGDSGRAIKTQPSGLAGVIISDKKAEADQDDATYAVALHVPNQILSFVERDRLPSPEELMAIVRSERPTSASDQFGEKPGNITVFTEDK